MCWCFGERLAVVPLVNDIVGRHGFHCYAEDFLCFTVADYAPFAQGRRAFPVQHDIGPIGDYVLQRSVSR